VIVFLIRHGETEHNAARVMQRPDAPLSARGREQARRLARRLAGAGIARILSSDYARARETAEILRGAADTPLLLEPLLRERNFGELRGRAYASFDFDPFAPDYVPPGGEGVPAFHERVARAWAAVEAAAASGPLAVVTHGLVCRAVVARHVEPAPGMDAAGALWRNTSLTILEGPPPFRVRLLDSAAHLEGGAGDDAGDRERPGDAPV
jgi:broad specificity phosphatase PhoE